MREDLIRAYKQDRRRLARQIYGEFLSGDPRSVLDLVRARGYEVDGLSIKGSVQTDFFAIKVYRERKVYVSAPVLPGRKPIRLLIRGVCYRDPIDDLNRGIHIVLNPPRPEESDFDQLIEAAAQQFPPLLLVKLAYRYRNKRSEILDKQGIADGLDVVEELILENDSMLTD